jgi:hypothetical protein
MAASTAAQNASLPARVATCVSSGRYSDATAQACCALRSFRSASRQDECNAVLQYFGASTGGSSQAALPGPTGAFVCWLVVRGKGGGEGKRGDS